MNNDNNIKQGDRNHGRTYSSLRCHIRRNRSEEYTPRPRDFWAVWCPPCKLIAPSVEELASEYEGKAVICKLNVDENHITAQKYGIRSIPTLLFFKGGEIVNQIVGAVPKDQLKTQLDKLL